MDAIYFTPATGGTIPVSDLDAHPSLVVVHSQHELESVAHTRTPIWIDKDSAKAVDVAWLRQHSRQSRCPVALIGYNKAIFSFRETLPIVRIHGPQINWKLSALQPGFSVWMVERISGNETAGYLKGFEQAPTVSVVSSVTTALLEGRHP